MHFKTTPIIFLLTSFFLIFTACQPYRSLPYVEYYDSESSNRQKIRELFLNEKSKPTTIYLDQDYEYPLAKRQTIIDIAGAFGIEKINFKVNPVQDESGVQKYQFYIEGIPKKFVKNDPWALHKEDLILPFTTQEGETLYNIMHPIQSRTVLTLGENDIRGDASSFRVYLSVPAPKEHLMKAHQPPKYYIENGIIYF